MAISARFVAIVAVLAATASYAKDGADKDGPYRWRLPPGFPVPKVPADNPMSEAKVALGCRLFFDNRLSRSGQISCATCHRPEFAFADDRRLSVGITGERTARNAMSLTNVAYNTAFTWASRVSTLEEQMRRPLFGEHPVEMGLTNDGAAAVAALARDSSYVDAFAVAFPDEPAPTMRNVIKAIAAYERTLIFGRSAFDRYVFDDDRATFSEQAKRGMALFNEPRVNCVRCHFGVNFSGPVAHERSSGIQPLFAHTAVSPGTDDGLAMESKRSEEVGRFRVPTLRNVALTAPYMHDGSMASLDDVLQHYSSSHGAPTDLRPLTLTRQERDELNAFLNSLTDTTKLESCAAGGEH